MYVCTCFTFKLNIEAKPSDAHDLLLHCSKTVRFKLINEADMNELINEAAEYEIIRTFVPKQINGLT